jgi:hypothetical protein
MGSMTTTTVCTGRSNKRSAVEAGEAAAREAMAGLNGAPADVVLVFGTTGYDQQELLRGVVAITGDTPLAGCSAEGIIIQGAADEGSHAVTVTAIASSSLTLHTFHVTDAARDPRAAGEALAAMVSGQPDAKRKLLVVFPDGLTINCTAFLGALQGGLASPAPLIAGGGAGGVMDTWQDYQYHAGKVYRDSVSALLIGGDVVADLVVSHGCQPMGIERTVTKVEAPYVVTIDDKPTVDVFREYIDDEGGEMHVEDLLFMCVGVKLPEEDAKGYGQLLIRSPVAGPDKERGAVPFAGQILEGSRIQMARRDPESMRDRAVDATRTLAARHEGERPLMVFHFDCAARGRVVLGEQAVAMGILPLQQALGTDLPWIGFYCFGEVAPLNRTTYYHNITAVVCALYDGHGGA